MADRIKFENITTGELDGTGHFDKLMRTLRAHIKEAVENNEITQSEAGQVYVGVMPSLIEQAVQYELGEKLTETKIEIDELLLPAHLQSPRN